MIRQGDVYWLDPGVAVGSVPGFRHPYVVVQNDLLNASSLATTIKCALTSNLQRARAPGNVALAAGEAGLSRASVVVVSQIYTFDKDELIDRIGRLSAERLAAVLDGLSLIFEPRDLPVG